MSRGWGGQGQAAAYAATCARLCAGAHPALLSALRPLTGRRVLDVGAGDGRLARALRGAGAHVVAVDPDPDMAGLTVGLPELPFEDGAFDLVVAAFVVNHLDDPRAGVAEMARVTAPGGRVVATIWPSGATAQSQMWQRVLDSVGVAPAPGVRLPQHLDFARTVEGLQELLAGAGLDAEAHPIAWTHRGPVDELWDGAAAGIGGIGATVAAQPVEVRERLRAAYEQEVRALVVDGELCFSAEAVLGVGVAPGRMGE
ncbi:class I SAM-dependent methyltransferase [uncultured Nocardioides sp.]|uniref:class I SAM-dependent methyltransferase n=1 Tax=uncultured Nocardioides sp. TaxID=198441 RepID=UPI0026333C70|nr:class I SAM-dependent methyltransferase [uncultured Nocardioides sp.]